MLEIIRGNFFPKFLCLHIKDKDKILRLFKYNKCLQKKLNITIIDYKNRYYQTIIEIEPGEAKNNIRENVFIRISRNCYNNYHIYFDNDKTEVKRNYIEYNEKIEKIKICIDYQVKSLKALFLYCNVEEISFIKYRRKDITDMSLMFYGCHSLINLDISKLNTEKVEKINLLFQGCSSLEKLDLSNFKTNNVTNMMGMFSFCSNLKKLNLSKFKTNKVTNMLGLFENCYSLQKLNLSNFKTDEVINMSYMFSFCTSLKFLDISNFKSDKVINMKYMFNHCESLVNLKIPKKFEICKDNSLGIFTNCSEELKEQIKKEKNLDEKIFDDKLCGFSFDHYRNELFNDEGKSEYIPFFLRLNSCYGAFNTYELINWKDPTKLKIL